MLFEPLHDSFGRRITYLRISLTDLCNFRCVYCLSPDDAGTSPRNRFLAKHEIVRFVKIITALGVDRIRLTGGEPLLRPDLLEIIRSLKAIETVRDLSITTNASRLAQMAEPLKKAGLDRINISLDSLNPERFREITKSDSYSRVLGGVFSALRAGFPVKLNLVAMKGLSNEEIIGFAKLAYDYPLEARFLEFMPLCGSVWQPELFVPIALIRSVVDEHFELESEGLRGDRVAESFAIRGGKGKIGFIGSLTESFCGECSRIRLTADGKILPCLFSEREVEVGRILSESAPDEEIVSAIRRAAAIKPAGNVFREKPFRLHGQKNPDSSFRARAVMQRIGG